MDDDARLESRVTTSLRARSPSGDGDANAVASGARGNGSLFCRPDASGGVHDVCGAARGMSMLSVDNRLVEMFAVRRMSSMSKWSPMSSQSTSESSDSSPLVS